MKRLLVFLKYPEPGKVKTRIGKEIGHVKAAQIYRELAERVLGNIMEGNYTVVLYYSPSWSVDDFKEWLGSDYVYKPQRGADLGQRMKNAIRDEIAEGAESVVLIGTDCVQVDSSVINKAFESMHDNDVVIGPATDGGYYLIACRASFNELFENIEWSTNKVYSQTMNRIDELGLKTFILEKKTDIDTYEDYQNFSVDKSIPNMYT